jgi:hypothetical protein
MMAAPARREMSFLRSIVLMTAVCLCVAFAFLVGHALAVHSMVPVLYGLGSLLLGAAVLALLARRTAHA